MNRSTLYADLAQLWLTLHTKQSLYFEPGRTNYRTAMSSAGADVAITADPTQVTTNAGLTVSIPGETAVTTDAELAVIVATHLIDVMTALSLDADASQRIINCFGRLCESTLPVVAGLSTGNVAQQTQREKLGRMLNVAAFHQLAVAVVGHDYQDKQAAHNNRLRFTEIGFKLQQTLSVTNDLVMYQQVSDLISMVGSAFRGFTDQLRPVAYYSPTEDRSVLAVAWNLYQNMDFVDDLVARNHNVASVLLRQPIEYLVE